MKFKVVSELEINGKIYDVSQSSIDLGDKNIEDAGIKILSENIIINSRVRNLYLLNNSITDIGLENLANSLKINDNIQYLDLSYNNIKGNCKTFSEYIGQSINIKSIDLSYNQIDDESIKNMFAGLKYNTSLEELNLLKNKITLDGLLYLKDFLVVNKTLKKLLLPLYNMGIQGVKVVTEVLKYNPGLDIIY